MNSAALVALLVLGIGDNMDTDSARDIRKLERRLAALERRTIDDGLQPIYRFSLASGRDDWGHFEDDKNTLVGLEINKLPHGVYWLRTYRQRYRYDGWQGLEGSVVPAGGDWFWHDWRIVQVENNIKRRPLDADWSFKQQQADADEYKKNPNKMRIVGFYSLDCPDIASPKVQYELIPIQSPDGDE